MTSKEFAFGDWEGFDGAIDRADREVPTRWFGEVIGNKVIKSLERNNIKGLYASDSREAFMKIMEMVPPGATIGFGDSVTLYQIGIIDQLRRGKYNLIDPWKKGVSAEETMELRRKALTADVFLSGANAITLDGKLIFLDGLGNRVAAILFGPKKVIIAAGVNKITRNLEEGMKRVKAVAAPMNYRRHNLTQLPCAITGVCSDCHSPFRACSQLVIIEQETPPQLRSLFYKDQRLHVVLIGESLGF